MSGQMKGAERPSGPLPIKIAGHVIHASHPADKSRLTTTANVHLIAVRRDKSMTNFCTRHKLTLEHTEGRGLVSLIPSGTSHFVAEFRDNIGYAAAKRALESYEVGGVPVVAEKSGENGAGSKCDPEQPVDERRVARVRLLRSVVAG